MIPGDKLTDEFLTSVHHTEAGAALAHKLVYGEDIPVSAKVTLKDRVKRLWKRAQDLTLEAVFDELADLGVAWAIGFLMPSLIQHTHLGG